jgi:hypothetical protein
MAKVIYPPTVGGIVGRVTTGVYYRARGTRFGYMRSYVMPRITTHNNLLGSYITNLKTIWQSVTANYKEQLDFYAVLYKDLPIFGDDSKQRTRSKFAIWYKILMFAQAQDPTHLDLATATIQDLKTLASDFMDISSAVTMGAIPAVTGYENWAEEMFT